MSRIKALCWRRFLIRAALSTLLILSVVTAVQMARPALARANPPVVVSLTYDDGTADQVQASSIMAKYGMVGTFFINSGRLGATGYMTAADAQSLQAAGNEIGGHTVSHADLPTLSPDEQARQICNDRVNLLNDGLQVSDFAYPYGDENSSVEQVAANCGYNSARGIGDVVSPGTCYGCAYAEQIPPVNSYALDNPDSIKSSTTLEDMENYVLQADQHGGGWVILTMHHICANCDPYSVPAVQLDAFLSWLAQRAASGTTVQTVAQVIGGTVKPGVNGPPPPPPLNTTNLIRNPSMETDSNNDGLPDCWQRGGYGTNTFTWSDTSDAHSGNVAQRVDIASFTSGDRRIMTPQDLGACAPGTVVGHTYQVSGWYKTNGNVRLVAYYRNAVGGWTFFAQGPQLPTSPTTYVQATWTTPAMPSGSTALSVGLSLRSTGFLQGDDFSLNDSDQTPPAVAITSPADGNRIRGTVTFTASASDASGVDHVDFLVNGVPVCTATTSPYSCAYDTTTQPDSVIAVTARAVDTAGNVGLSAGHNYTVSNSVPLDTTSPTVAVTGPADGSTVNRTVTLTADATDNDAVSEVLFYVNGMQIGATDTAPYQVSWDTSTVPDGTVTAVAKALDLSGNLGTSAPITLTINNNSLDTTPPVSSITCNNSTCSTGWYNTAVTVALSEKDDGSGVQQIVYTTDGTDPTATNGTVYAGPFTLSSSTTVKYRAWDNAGNVEQVNTASLSIDTVPPTAAVGAPADGSSLTGTVYIKASVSDNVGIARVWFYLDGKALGSRIVTPYQWKWDTTTTTKGAHTLYVIAVDSAGNQTRSSSVTVTVT